MSDYIDWLLREETKRKAPLDYGKIKISAKQLDDAILNIGTLKVKIPSNNLTAFSIQVTELAASVKDSDNGVNASNLTQTIYIN